VITKVLIDAVHSQFALNWYGIHGVRHWARVYANGMRLASDIPANIKVIQLFALFHDCCRLSEGSDPMRGLHGAELAGTLCGRLFHLADDEFVLLEEACKYHTTRLHHDNPTVAICFDADRLDLGRVGNTPDPDFLCTPQAKKPATIRWAVERFLCDHLPANILAESLEISKNNNEIS
jgi:uncharacterized protein